MSIYTTPLQFGYFMALLFAVLFWIRGRKEERLSDSLMGFVLLFLALDIQDYTFGFAGINVLWNELNGFPRGIALLTGPSIYFYLKSQTNFDFKLQRKHLIHLIPYATAFTVEFVVFVQGPYAVQRFQESQLASILNDVNFTVMWASYIYYFYMSISLYRRYRRWIKHNYSDVPMVSLHWFRNFIYVFIAGLAFKQAMTIADTFMQWEFYQDWWWNLGLVAIIAYVSIQGYAQPQMVPIHFDDSEVVGSEEEKAEQSSTDPQWDMALTKVMVEEKAYLNPELTLSSLAKKVELTPLQTSEVINGVHGSNFNEYVNGFRVAHFKEEVVKPENKALTLLAVALDSGFNSKATFNRVFKKIEGVSPKEYVTQHS